MAEKRVSLKNSKFHNGEVEKLLIENFVSLQKVLTNLSLKFDNLAEQISELLHLFEDSAKILVKKELSQNKEEREDKRILNTMNSILEQNKIIARGLTLIYENQGNPIKSLESLPKKIEGLENKSQKINPSLKKTGDSFSLSN